MHSQVKEQLNTVIEQRDVFCKDFNHTFAKHAELKKNFESLKLEKDAAVREYALVMSERDTVHKVIKPVCETFYCFVYFYLSPNKIAN